MCLKGLQSAFHIWKALFKFLMLEFSIFLHPSNSHINLASCYRKHKREKRRYNMSKNSERLNMGLSLLCFFQLLVEWVLQLQSRTKDWHLSWPWSIHSHIAVLWDGTRCRISFPLLHPAVTCLRGTHSTFGHPVAPTLISDTNIDHVMSEAIIIATGCPPVF